MKIEIHDRDIETQSLRSKKDGSAFDLRFQMGYAHIKNKRYPVQIRIQLEDAALPYEPGEYQLDTDSFIVDQYQKLCFSRHLKLSRMTGEVKSIKTA